MWTPILDFVAGTSGCQSNCVACGHLCPTAAIRPLSLKERMGLGEFKDKGPVRLGTAFVDKNRCLPWAMDRPCNRVPGKLPREPQGHFHHGGVCFGPRGRAPFLPLTFKSAGSPCPARTPWSRAGLPPAIIISFFRINKITP